MIQKENYQQELFPALFIAISGLLTIFSAALGMMKPIALAYVVSFIILFFGLISFTRVLHGTTVSRSLKMLLWSVAIAISVGFLVWLSLQANGPCVSPNTMPLYCSEVSAPLLPGLVAPSMYFIASALSLVGMVLLYIPGNRSVSQNNKKQNVYNVSMAPEFYMAVAFIPLGIIGFITPIINRSAFGLYLAACSIMLFIFGLLCVKRILSRTGRLSMYVRMTIWCTAFAVACILALWVGGGFVLPTMLFVSFVPVTGFFVIVGGIIGLLASREGKRL